MKKFYIKPETTIKQEEWKVYKKTSNSRWGDRVYEFSNLGRVRINNKITTKFQILNSGYYWISHILIHRAVAELFIQNPENKPCIDHIDGNRLNNKFTNLRWVSYIENNNNPITRNRISKSRKNQPSPIKGIPKTTEHKNNLREAQKQYYKEHPDIRKGKNNPAFDRRWMHNKTNDQVYPSADQIQYYLDKGYIFGKLKPYLNKQSRIMHY